MRSATEYRSFLELACHEEQGRDFRVVHRDRPDAHGAVLAPHGGMIEVGTSEIATLIAGAEYSLFCFEGLKSYGENAGLHITSHLFDHPDCIALAVRHDMVLTVHGCKGEDSCIFLGGLDVDLVRRLATQLALAKFNVISDGARYPGRHPLNICNRGASGKGAQLEITYDLRRPQHREEIAGAVRRAMGGTG
jgi:phage replication-related protein YjqB (UPF0714/DUF867 family)